MHINHILVTYLHAENNTHTQTSHTYIALKVIHTYTSQAMDKDTKWYSCK